MEHPRSGFVDQFQMLQHCIAGKTTDSTHEVGSRVRQKNGTGSSAESRSSHLPWHQYQPIFGLQNVAIQPQLQRQNLLNEIADLQKHRTRSSAGLQLLSHLPWHQYQPIFGLQNVAIQPQLQRQNLLNEIADLQKYRTRSGAGLQLLSHLPWHEHQPTFGTQNVAIQPQQQRQNLLNEIADLQKYRTRSGAGLQLLSNLPWHQHQPTFGMQNFAIQPQQHRLLNEIARTSVQETGNMGMPSEINKTKIGSYSPLLFASSEEVYPHNRHDRSPQSNEKSTMIMQVDDNIADDAKQVREVRKQSQSSIQTNRVDKTEGPLQENENQVNSSVLMKKGNLGDEKDSVVLHKMFPCAECGKEFQRKDYLVQHKRIHTGEKPFDCHICNKSFRQKQALNTHLLRHSGVKPFQCHICNKCFRQKTTLNNHLLCHSGERPFACNICQRSFSRKDVLTRHMHTHSSCQKLHNCDVCQKSFLQNSALSSHQKQCHSKDKE